MWHYTSPIVEADYHARPQRVLVFHVKAWDINCTQHITQRFTLEQVNEASGNLRNRIQELEAENIALRQKLDLPTPRSATPEAVSELAGRRVS